MEPVTPRRSTYSDLPKPETGLAEWTSKIKALQRQVDADEEAEQRRLEDEIAASRKARLRRSKGMGYGGDSLDLSNPSADIVNSTLRLDASPSTGAFRSSLNRKNDHDDALRKLAGTSTSSNIDTSSITSGILPRPSQYPTAPASQRADPVSLASFIGGRATGPRLNRHAPQQDAHDPTQFEQRTFTAPHPIFGQGGVAMPGMTTKPSNVRGVMKASASDAVERYQSRLSNRTSTSSLVKQVDDPPQAVSPLKVGPRDRTISTPSVARKYLAQVEQRPASPEKPGFRERKISTPGTPNLGARSSDIPGPRSLVNEITPTTELRPKTPTKDRWSANEVPTMEIPPKTPTRDRRLTNEIPLRTEMRPKTPTRDRTFSSAKAGDGIYTPRQVPSIVNTPPTPAAKSISSIPSLARPIQPEPRSLSQISIASSNVPSPAFLRSSPQKDPTPSISRLQGRGFVQNMVKASSQLTNSTKAAPSPPERTKPVAGRKSNVLERWQPNATPTPPSPASKQTLPTRKSFVADATSSSPLTKLSTPSSVPSSPTPSKPLKTKVSFPNMLHPDPLMAPEPLSPRRAKLAEKMLPPEGSPGFGSATTMVVYKPTNAEATSQPIKEPVDELGVKNDSGRENKPRSRVSSDISTPSGKPLNHPTKERPRKPKKNRDASGGAPPTEVHATRDPINNPGPLQPPPSAHLQSSQLPDTSSPLINESVRVFPPRVADRSPVRNDRESENDPPPKVSHIAQQWGQNAPIGLRSVSPSTQVQSHSGHGQIESKVNSNLIRRALPGMTGENSLRMPYQASKSKTPSPEQTLTHATKSNATQQSSPSNSSGYTGSTSSNDAYSPASPTKGERAGKPPPSPKNKHSRIPSTGNRALVMDVAQALNEHVSNEMIHTQEETVPVPEKMKTTLEQTIPRQIITPSMERRKSVYDRFSVISVMPPLKEEATPNATPYSSINRAPANLDNKLSSIESGTPFKNGQHVRVESASTHDVVHFDLDNRPLPPIDLTPLLQLPKKPVHFTDAHTISVEVFVVNGGSTTSITQDTDVFYDSEILAIVHRYKSKSSGLVEMQLWQWNGKRSNLGEREGRKLQELAKRYNTSPILARQNSEPAQMVQLLGGKLVIRQGSRSHWSADNTAMYSIRMLGGVVYIDEHDLSAKNLCSAFSFCVIILDTIYVWYGCGSTDAERQATFQYGDRLAGDANFVIELHEGEDEGEELFWMALGDGEFAKAHYWRWRRDSSITDPRIWRLDYKTQLKPTMVEVSSFGKEAFSKDSIYMIDSIWELFVVVGKQARGDRFGIRIAVDVAKRVSKVTGSSKPFTPPVHVLVLPSMLPVDLRLNLREMDEAEVNNHDIPDHMNLLSCAQAESHLQQQTWERIALRDQTMLPLGVSTPVAL